MNNVYTVAIASKCGFGVIVRNVSMLGIELLVNAGYLVVSII